MQIFLSAFKDVPDPRASNARHDLGELLVIAFVSVLCGSSSCAEMAAFGRAKEHLFRDFLKLKHALPSHDTFSDVFRMIDPKALDAAFGKVLADVAALLKDGDVIAIDGKALRGALQLDFTAKRKDLEGQSAGYARMLSSFAYAKIQTTIRRSAIRAGVELVDINPAYTSVIGRVNYAERYGLSVHISAAVSIARRAAQFSERVNYFHGLRGRRNTLNAKIEQRRHVWRQWAQVRKDLSTPGGSRNWLVTSNAISFAPRAVAHASAASGAAEMAIFEADRLALEELVSNGTSNPGSSSLGGCDQYCSIMSNIDHV